MTVDSFFLIFKFTVRGYEEILRVLKKKTEILNFKKNIILFWAGLFSIVLGYIFLSIGPKDSFFSLTLAPIVLVIGYTVVIPFALFLPANKPSKVSNEEIKGD